MTQDSSATPLVSAIIPTIARRDQLRELLESLCEQSHTRLQVVVVDQNHGGFLDAVLASYGDRFEDFVHLKVPSKGAAAARNRGAEAASGEIFCFPDDDSRVLPDTITRAVDHFADDANLGVLFGKTIDESGKDSVVKFFPERSVITRDSMAGKFIEATIFVKKGTFTATPFDESFGIGTFYGAEEVYDLVLRMLSKGVSMLYDPEVKFYHPQKILTHTSAAEIRRVFQYRCGFAHLCRKHRLYWKFIKQVVLVAGYCVVLLFWSPRKIRYYISELLGLFTGLIA